MLNVASVEITKTRQPILGANAFKSKVILSFFIIKDYDLEFLLWNRNGEFMSHMPNLLILYPYSSEDIDLCYRESFSP